MKHRKALISKTPEERGEGIYKASKRISKIQAQALFKLQS